MFELIPTGESGLDFANTITEDARINYFNFMHLYMGAGVAVGDVNNDGLQDIYFTGTLVTNKLYLNRGNMVFEDITEKAGVDGGIGFTTGVTMVDINQDGWLDIYVCQSGWFPDTEYLKNKLFINNGDETFTESADSYGLADRSHSIQSNFFDYDNDGDLDVYVINTPVEFDLSFKYIEQDKIERNTLLKTKGGDDRLYRNEGNGKIAKSE
ncbi:MAG: VCBS repeat-containing protein [Bacteroidetes bacterium]|nr:VCBS repeat-containing protein [Bacteroidota bacterium]